MLKRLLLFLLFPIACFGQLWSGVIDPSRAVDWSTVGVTGGIPSRTTICANTQCAAVTSAGTSATAAQINSALANCPSGQVVLLTNGTYTLNNGLNMKANCTLRGAGTNSTKLVFTAQNTNPYWGSCTICFLGSGYTGGFETHPPGMEGSQNCTGSVGPPPTYSGCTQLVQWLGTNGVSGTYTKGATTLNLASIPASLVVGLTLHLSQADDQSIPATGPLVCQVTSSTSGCSREGNGLTYDNTAMRQNVKVTAINGTAVTVTPGIYADFWVTAKNPVAFWWTGDIQLAGIESLTVTENLSDSSSLWSTIDFFQASDSWIYRCVIQPHNGGVGAGNSTRHGVIIHSSRNITVQDNWLGPMFGGGAQSTTSYGITNVQSSANLIQNNILFNVESPIITTGGPSGDVYAYNFDPGVCTPNTGCTGIWLGHDEGGMFNLLEGNIGPLTRKDTFHGNEMFQTVFRNRLTGTEQNESTEPTVDLYALSHYFNYIGNVLGTSTVATIYECEHNTGAGCDRFGTSIFRLGYPGEGANNSECGSPGCLVYDSQVKTTIMRWGNYDTVNNAVRFLSAEVPSGIPDHANPVPATHTLPASFYLSSKPTWVGASKPWPLIGPDVTGGNISGVGGFANTNPAQDCYTAAGGLVANFNPAVCFAASGSPAVQLTPSTLTFSNQLVGTTSTSQTSTLKNTGTATLNISSISIAGANPSSWSQSNNCGSTVIAGASCTITVSFSPVTPGSLPASVSIVSNSPTSPDVVSLSGFGLTSVITGNGSISGNATIKVNP